MNRQHRIAAAVARALEGLEGPTCPPTLATAMRWAVLPGGSRLRPGLCLAVAEACGDDDPGLADAAAAAVELLHCASLVHDDLPVFDDAELRRGRATVHRRFGEPVALLAGDGLIVRAFEVLGAAGTRYPERLPAVLAEVARGVGAPHGIVAGQAWESEPRVDLSAYHRAKTGALFEAAAAAGAAAAGHDPHPWRTLGSHLGEAYQVADDLFDAGLSGTVPGAKAPGRDAALGRPNATATLGVDGARARLGRLTRLAREAIPEVPGRDAVDAWLVQLAGRLAPDPGGASAPARA